MKDELEVNYATGKDVTAGYVIMEPERLREAAQRVCNRMKLLCGITAPEGSNITRLGA